MVRIDVVYEGNLRTTATHVPSGAKLATDAPKDNEGLGETFSPTDLVATALGTCMLTTMGILAKRKGIRIEGAGVSVEKHMVADPLRRVGRLTVRFDLPGALSADERKILENAALTCPVHRSLRADVDIPVEFRYGRPA
jgi:putative redox protein